MTNYEYTCSNCGTEAISKKAASKSVKIIINEVYRSSMLAVDANDISANYLIPENINIL